MSPSANINPTWPVCSIQRKTKNSDLTPGKKDHQQIGTRFPKHLRTTLGRSTIFSFGFSPFCFSSTKMKFRFSRESTWDSRNVRAFSQDWNLAIHFSKQTHSCNNRTSLQVRFWVWIFNFPKIFQSVSGCILDFNRNSSKQTQKQIHLPFHGHHIPFNFQKKKNNQPAVDKTWRPSRHVGSRWRTFAAHSWRKDISKPPKCDLFSWKPPSPPDQPLTHNQYPAVEKFLRGWNPHFLEFFFGGDGKFQQDSGNRISR